MGLLVLALLAAYWYSFSKVWRGGFAASGWIRANGLVALVLLVPAPIVLAGIYYFMIMDWPMNIGGKPNYSLYHNLPIWPVVLVAWVGVLPSWWYLRRRIRRARRNGNLTPP